MSQQGRLLERQYICDYLFVWKSVGGGSVSGVVTLRVR